MLKKTIFICRKKFLCGWNLCENKRFCFLNFKPGSSGSFPPCHWVNDCLWKKSILCRSDSCLRTIMFPSPTENSFQHLLSLAPKVPSLNKVIFPQGTWGAMLLKLLVVTSIPNANCLFPSKLPIGLWPSALPNFSLVESLQDILVVEHRSSLLNKSLQHPAPWKNNKTTEELDAHLLFKHSLCLISCCIQPMSVAAVELILNLCDREETSPSLCLNSIASWVPVWTAKTPKRAITQQREPWICFHANFPNGAFSFVLTGITVRVARATVVATPNIQQHPKYIFLTSF